VAELARGALGLTLGEELDEDRLRAAIGNVLGLGVFADVEVAATPAEGGVGLTFALTVRPWISAVVVDGDAALPPLRPLAALGGGLFDPVGVERERRAALAGLVAAGYEDAAITVATAAAAAGVALRVHVALGARATIRRFVIDGVHALPVTRVTAQLRRELGTVNAVGGVVDADRLLDDGVPRVLADYADLGYVTASLARSAIERGAAGERIVRLTFHEGPRFRIGAITVTGPGAAALRASLTVRADGPYDGRRVGLEILRLRRRVADVGAVLDVDTTPQLATSTVDLTLTLRPARPEGHDAP
jgi:outer membrane protein assembly factor BamA